MRAQAIEIMLLKVLAKRQTEGPLDEEWYQMFAKAKTLLNRQENLSASVVRELVNGG